MIPNTDADIVPLERDRVRIFANIDKAISTRKHSGFVARSLPRQLIPGLQVY